MTRGPATRRRAPEWTIDAVDVHAFDIPTDGPGGREQDGTLEWDSTTAVLVRVRSGDRTGIGYTYGDVSVAHLLTSQLVPLLLHADASSPSALWHRMGARLRNAGRPGAGAMAVSAADVALWDLKARLLGLPLTRLLPAFHDHVPVYGSGGFTNYPVGRLTEQLAGWVDRGIPRVKMKTGRDRNRTRSGWPPYAARSVTRLSCSPTRTARSAAGRRCTGRSGTPRSGTSTGSRSR